MKFDVARHLGAVSRAVRDIERDGKRASVVAAVRHFAAEPKGLWDALTNIKRIPRWFLPISGDLRQGGRFQLQGNAGGRITRCEPPKLLEVTWEYGGEVSWVTVTLAPDKTGGSRLTLEHAAHIDEKRWDQYGPGAVGVGWDMALLGLGHHLATGETIDSKEAVDWLSTAEGKRFVRQSSDDWCRASIAAGTASEQAKASAERTRAAYSGEPKA